MRLVPGAAPASADHVVCAPSYTCCRPVSIFDMNAGGTPEVVLFQSTGKSWGDLVLRMRACGAWRMVAVSPAASSARRLRALLISGRRHVPMWRCSCALAW